MDKVSNALAPNLIKMLNSKVVFIKSNFVFTVIGDTKENLQGKKLSEEELDRGESIYIPKKTFDGLKVNIKPFSPVNLHLVEWKNSMFHLNGTNNYKVTSTSKSISVFDSNLTRISPELLNANFEFSLRPSAYSKVYSDLLVLPCDRAD